MKTIPTTPIWRDMRDRHVVEEPLPYATLPDRLRYHWEAAVADFKVRHPLAYRRLFVIRAVLTRR